MARRRFADSIVAQINSKIRAAAFVLRAEKREHGEDTGVRNHEIVNRIKHDVHAILSRHFLLLTEHYLSTQVSIVLEGRTAERRISTIRILPGLELPEWLAVPPDTHKGSDVWKVSMDCSPNELKRIENTRSRRIVAEQAELEKIRVIRQTAESLDCDPDEPISTVFDDKPPPTSPSVGDSPRP
jgi:hypothetical protein